MTFPVPFLLTAKGWICLNRKQYQERPVPLEKGEASEPFSIETFSFRPALVTICHSFIPLANGLSTMMPLNLNHQFSPVPSQDLWAGGAGGSYLSRSFSKATYWKIKTGRANVRPMSFPCFSRRCDRHVPEFEGKNFPMKSPTCPKKINK